MSKTCRAWCEVGQHYPEEILAITTPMVEMGYEIPVVQGNNGEPTNRFADGIVGVPDHIAAESMVDEDPICAEHTDCYITWDHS